MTTVQRGEIPIRTRNAVANVASWIVAILAIALFLALLLDLIPFWSFYILLVVCGLGAAGDAVRIAIVTPRSPERFHSLCHRLSSAAIAMMFGTIGLFGHINLGIDPTMRARASLVMYLCMPVCLIAYFAWYQHISKNYGIQKSHPDFGEDSEGNPLRSTGMEPR